MRISEILTSKCKSDKIAVYYSGKSISYRQMHLRVQRTSEALKPYIKKGKCIGIFIPNSINYTIAYFTIAYLDKVIVPLNPRMKTSELLSSIDYCDMDMIVSDSANLDHLIQQLEGTDCTASVFNIDTFCCEVSYNRTPYNELKERELKGVALMLHTSGSLSSPKQVMLTHHNLIACVKSVIESLSITEMDRTLIALPMFLASANTSQFLTHMYLGASIVIMDGIFTPAYFHRMVQDYKITNFTGVPFMLIAFAKYGANYEYDISTLRCFCFGGAPTPVHFIKSAIETFPSVEFIHMYGQTEASTRISHCLGEFARDKIGSVGKPIPGMQWRVMDKEGKQCGANEIGEIAVKGDNIMKGYYGRPDLTKQVIKGKWLYTGDIGRLDDDGFMYICGRMKNVIIRGGMNIYPEEIEEIIMKHSCVKEVCVTSESHEMLGEVPVANIVVSDNNSISENDILAFCNIHMSNYKIPGKIVFVNSLEKTTTGKIMRKRANK